MYEQKKTVETGFEPAGRAAWERPELRQLKAGAAEANPNGNADNVILS